MVDVLAVAEYILDKTGYVSTMKLQKLVFYSNALSLARNGEPLFPEQFQAWVNGPVCRELFCAHRGKFIIGPGELGVSREGFELDTRGRACVDETLRVLGGYDGNALSELTHRESPWREARRGCKDNDRCENVITNEAVRSYYSSYARDNPLFSTA